MAAEFAIAKKVGKGQNAMSLKEIVALPTVPVMENASEDSASASLDGKVIIWFPKDSLFLENPLPRIRLALILKQTVLLGFRRP